MDIEIDLWTEIVEPLVPLLEELERIERLATGGHAAPEDEPEDGNGG